MNAAQAQLLLTLLALAALPVAAVIAYRLGHRHRSDLSTLNPQLSTRSPWARIHVSTTRRGPSADAWYWTTPAADGRPIDLTDEQLLAAKLSATHHRAFPHRLEPL